MSKQDKASTTERLWEYKVIYTNSAREFIGEHYYMCTNAEEAINSHSIIAESHHRLLPVSGVYKYCPYQEEWLNETELVTELIKQINENPRKSN